MLGSGADDGPSNPRPEAQRLAQWAVGAAEFTPRFVAEMAIKPGWAMRMLGTDRRTFRNIAGHVSDAVNLASLTEWTRTQFDLTLNWKDVGWIKDRFGGPVIVKGVLDAEDAQLAIDNGADAEPRSSSGGRMARSYRCV